MATRVYGASDDLIEFEGDIRGEVSVSGGEPILIAFSDGTVAVFSYGKPGLGGIWSATVLRAGDRLIRKAECVNEDDTPYSDELFFSSIPGHAFLAWDGRGQRVR